MNITHTHTQTMNWMSYEPKTGFIEILGIWAHQWNHSSLNHSNGTANEIGWNSGNSSCSAEERTMSLVTRDSEKDLWIEQYEMQWNIGWMAEPVSSSDCWMCVVPTKSTLLHPSQPHPSQPPSPQLGPTLAADCHNQASCAFENAMQVLWPLLSLDNLSHSLTHTATHTLFVDHFITRKWQYEIHVLFHDPLYVPPFTHTHAHIHTHSCTDLPWQWIHGFQSVMSFPPPLLVERWLGLSRSAWRTC